MARLWVLQVGSTEGIGCHNLIFFERDNCKIKQKIRMRKLLINSVFFSWWIKDKNISFIRNAQYEIRPSGVTPRVAEFFANNGNMPSFVSLLHCKR